MTLGAIISGGQNGADQAGLRAARTLGLWTGGWAPAGWRTLDGAAPWLADLGLREAPLADYPTRTLWNVRDSDATVRFAVNFQSAGERCTMAAILKQDKPHLDIPVRSGAIDDHYIGLLRCFLPRFNVNVLNVAGNSERTAPGIGALVERFLVEAIGIGNGAEACRS
jgi:hypothetical protein